MYLCILRQLFVKYVFKLIVACTFVQNKLINILIKTRAFIRFNWIQTFIRFIRFNWVQTLLDWCLDINHLCRHGAVGVRRVRLPAEDSEVEGGRLRGRRGRRWRGRRTFAGMCFTRAACSGPACLVPKYGMQGRNTGRIRCRKQDTGGYSRQDTAVVTQR